MQVVARLVAVVFFVTLAGFAPAPAEANPKYAAYVIHADTGDVLFDRNATSQRFPASLTKMMTLYILFEEIEAGRTALTDKLTASETAVGQPPSKLGVTAGEKITVETAVQALVVKSANDVAVMVAEHIEGTEWKFSQRMTRKAKALGMANTTFRNASGLPNPKQTSTARDIAVLSQRLMQDFPQHYHYFAIQGFTYKDRSYRTHNQLVKDFPGADGLKTGYTRASGFNLATSAVRNGDRLIGVVLGGRTGASRDAHMREILDKAFEDIGSNPALLASLRRLPPRPNIKPTLLAALEARGEVPTLAASALLADEIRAAAVSLGAGTDTSGVTDYSLDRLGALIAAVGANDFNETERIRLTLLEDSDNTLGEGDLDDTPLRTWQAQIGAYSDKSKAQAELEAAATAADFGDRPRGVSPVQSETGKVVYRARFLALTQQEAAEVCRRLDAARRACHTVDDANTAAR